MKLLIVFVLFLIKFCDSNDFRCVHISDTMESIDFYCENFNETLPANCKTMDLYSISDYNKSEVTELKIGGCDEDKINQIVDDFINIQSLDISCSNLQSLKPFKRPLQHLRKFNASHNHLTENPNEIWAQMPVVVEVDLSHNNIPEIRRDDMIDLPKLECIGLRCIKKREIDYKAMYANLENLKTPQLEFNNGFPYFDVKEFENNANDQSRRYSEKDISMCGGMLLDNRCCSFCVTCPTMTQLLHDKGLDWCVDAFGEVDEILAKELENNFNLYQDRAQTRSVKFYILAGWCGIMSLIYLCVRCADHCNDKSVKNSDSSDDLVHIIDSKPSDINQNV